MWGTHSKGSVSFHARAKIGEIFKSIGVSKSRGVSAEEFIAETDKVFDSSDFEVHTVETKGLETSKIFVSRPSEAAYFEEAEEFVPTIISAADKVTASEPVVEINVKKEKITAAEPADLFINALRKPARKSFDRATPRIKASSAPVSEMPVKEAVKAVPEEVETVVAAPVIETVHITEDVKVEAEAVSVPVAEPVVTEVPVIEAISVESSSIEVPAAAEPAVAEPVVEAVPEEAESFVEDLEIAESKVEHEVIAKAAETAEEVFAAAQAQEEKSEPVIECIAAPMTVVPALPARIEVPALEPAEPEIGFVTPAEETVIAEPASTSAEAYEAPICKSETFEPQGVEALPLVVVNESRDILFAFNSDLEADEIDFMSTSMDDNLAFSEDILDEDQFRFKMRAPQRRFDGNFRSLFC